jgi:hypothetical protein
MAGGRQIGAGALFGALLGHGDALLQGARNFARRHGLGSAACVVVDAIDRACKFNGSLPEQCGQAHIGMSPINQR